MLHIFESNFYQSQFTSQDKGETASPLLVHQFTSVHLAGMSLLFVSTNITNFTK